MALWLLNIKNLLLSVQEASYPCLDQINYIHNNRMFYHGSALVVLAVLRFDVLEFVLEVFCELLVVVFGLFQQVARGVAEGGAFVWVLLLKL